MSKEFHYRWEFDLESPPEKLWPLIADTNRFNRDTGVPAVKALGATNNDNRRRLGLSILGMSIEWDEQPFEWVRPQRFGVVRRYSKGPMEELRVRAELAPCNGGTRLVYEIWARPRTLIGRLLIPIQIGFISARNFARTFRGYDKTAQAEIPVESPLAEPQFAPGGRARLTDLGRKLVDDGLNEELIALLVDHIQNADDFTLARLRPYRLANQWRRPRRAVLESCLHATRGGMLDLQWNLICPMCRGGEAKDSLAQLSSSVHCEGCNVDFSVNFEQSVEITFRPNPSIRQINVDTFCIGGPQVTPHIVAQQLLATKTQRTISIQLEEGRYRLRATGVPGSQHLLASENGAGAITLSAENDGWADNEVEVSTSCELQLENELADEQLFVLERMAWSDEAATAAEVTALQTFRDLFAREALRPGEQISVGTLTVLFTDLKNSTLLYREIGDATAFGRVMNHFDVLKEAIAAEDGALVKTIGDAVMAVFRRPANAMRAMFTAQEQLASPPAGMTPLTLKAGLHTGPCIAVTLNDRLDYFGSTVNLAARLEGQSNGNDVVISGAVYSDPEVREMLLDSVDQLAAEPFEIELKGFADERFELWRVRRDREQLVRTPTSRGSDRIGERQ